MWRRLGPSEKFIWKLDRECSWNFAVHARVEGDFPENALRAALDRTQQKHPLLCAKINKMSWAEAVFDRLEEAPIPLVMENVREDAVVPRIEATLHEPFPVGEGPLCRCLLLRHNASLSTLIATFHHSIGDAMSGVYFLQDLAESLARVRKGEDPHVTPLELQGPMEDNFPPWARGLAGAWGQARFMARMTGTRAKMGNGTLLNVKEKALPSDRKACLIQKVLEPEVVGRILKKARAHKTTVHGALGAAAMRAVAGQATDKKKLSFVLGSDINLRPRLCPPVERDLGFFITGVFTAHESQADTDFWVLAKQVKDSLARGLARGEHFYGAAMVGATESLMRWAGNRDFGCRLCARVTDAMNPGMLVLSNIGTVSMDTGGPLIKVDKVGFVSSFSATTTFGLHAATTDDTMVLNFVGMEPVHSRRQVSDAADFAANLLRSV